MVYITSTHISLAKTSHVITAREARKCSLPWDQEEEMDK